MKKFIQCSVLAFACLVLFNGCGGQAGEKGAAEKGAEMDPEQKKLRDQVMKSGQEKQFGNRKDEAPSKED